MTTLRMDRADTPDWRWAVTQPDASDPTVRVVVDLSAATVTFLAKRSTDDLDAAAVITKTVGSGITLTDAANGKVRLQLLKADTSSLTVPTALVWALKVEIGSTAFTVDEGKLLIAPQVIRA